MRDHTLVALKLFLTAVVVMVGYFAIMFIYSLKNASIGPNQPTYLPKWAIVNLNSDVIMESESYFEIRLSNNMSAPIQSTFRNPKFGETNGYYEIVGKFEGEYQTSGGQIKIYSKEPTEVKFKSNEKLNFVFSFIIILLLSIPLVKIARF